jgi:hypothetical protein
MVMILNYFIVKYFLLFQYYYIALHGGRQTSKEVFMAPAFCTLESDSPGNSSVSQLYVTTFHFMMRDELRRDPACCSHSHPEMPSSLWRSFSVYASCNHFPMVLCRVLPAFPLTHLCTKFEFHLLTNQLLYAHLAHQ